MPDESRSDAGHSNHFTPPVVTIVRRTEDGFEIVGEPQGDDRLGGIDLDSLVWDHVAGVVGTETLDPGGDPTPTQLRAIAQIRAAAVDAKEGLSYDTQAVVPITLAELMTEVRITRREFEEMARPALGRTVDVLQQTCEAAGVAPGGLAVLTQPFCAGRHFAKDRIEVLFPCV